MHYGPTEYVKIADNQKGDAGIEGYTRCGRAYQCYGCEEPISTEVRYANQRDKITRDIKKFIDNKDKLLLLFGNTKIIRWVLFVPFSDSKDIVAHANTKRSEVIDAKLPFVGDGFQVHVCDEDHFSGTRDRLLNSHTEALKLTPEIATSEEIRVWSEAQPNDQLLRTLDGKLGRLNTLTTNEQRSRFRDTILRWYLEGQDLLDNLRSYPQIHERILAAKVHRENGLVAACLTHEGTAAGLLKETLRELLVDFRSEAQMLAKSSAESLAREAVSDWLLRCPLDFPG